MEIPFPWSGDDLLADAYRRGYGHGHGLACHNAPKLGSKLWLDDLGRVQVDAENIREVHQSLCHAGADNSRCYSPFEFTAKEFNDSEHRDDLWEAFEAGTADAIAADLQTYTAEDYGIAPDDDDGAQSCTVHENSGD